MTDGNYKLLLSWRQARMLRDLLEVGQWRSGRTARLRLNWKH